MHLKPQKSYIDSVNKYVSKNTRSCFKNKTKENINQTTRKIKKEQHFAEIKIKQIKM